ncbi:hypothetical protein BJF78_29410 [Pseudonocardia sp. CNS-139]|nr:hypothetical protein BJF78_29410 [Pseudonocardia sp. CNS-139]
MSGAATSDGATHATDAPESGLLATFRGKLAMYRALRTIPDNEELSFLTALSPLLRQAPAALPLVGEAHRRRRGALFEDDMRLLNDVLADGPLAGRYWVWAGLLLGWAREGRVLPHDVGDADFAFSARDDALLAMAEDQLAEAGFRRWFSFRNHAGERTERVYVRNGFRFEFFRMDDVGEDTHEYHMYGPGRSGTIEFVGHLPRRGLEPFEFLDRTWLKPRDHELLLRTCYGDWRTPDPTWSVFDDRSLVARRVWRPAAAAR